MILKKNTNYFIAQNSAVLRQTPATDGDAVNHLLFGDWLRWLGQTDGDWEKIKCRGDTGWVRKSDITETRALEVNFVDIGQGDGTHIVTPDDQVLVIDAGKTDNMLRYLSWRYNLRGRKVKGVDGVEPNDRGAKDPFHIDRVMVSHPDKDHYYGFKDIFEHPKLSVGQMFHNGIVERSVSKADKEAVKDIPHVKYLWDLGLGYSPKRGENYLTEIIGSNRQLRDLEKAQRHTKKDYMETLRAAVANPNNKGMRFQALDSEDGFVPGFEDGAPVTMEILGPVPQRITIDGARRKVLPTLGDEGETKNGHSVVVKLRIGALKILLGGDLNTASEDYLFRHYCTAQEDVSDLEKTIFELEAKGSTMTDAERQELDIAQASIEALVAKGRKTFQVDVAKACHHGSHHFSETFLRALNALAVVISSGDDEAYAHPRPDALGAFGRYGRGHRPLIFSTEISRRTREFSKVSDFYERILDFKKRIDEAPNKRERKKVERELEEAKDRNVAVYGMITLRSDGDRTIMAQKIELPTRNDQKWDIHELKYNENVGEFRYVDKTKESH